MGEPGHYSRQTVPEYLAPTRNLAETIHECIERRHGLANVAMSAIATRKARNRRTLEVSESGVEALPFTDVHRRILIAAHTMSSILDLIPSDNVRRFDAGEIVIEQGTKTGLLFFLVEGSVEVLKNGVRIATTSQPAAVFGELSALLEKNHSVTVRALEPCTFRVVEDARGFLEKSPVICMHVCEVTARRLDALINYLVDVRRQFEGTGHLEMLDEILETLMHRQGPKRVRPSDSTIRKGELAD
jgi:CRP/FNR family transcriptional regulator, cyclic AMP receptor protein